MVNPRALEGQVDDTGPFLAVACAVKLKLFGFVFRRELADFVADPSFIPFFWRRKGDDVVQRTMTKITVHLVLRRRQCPKRLIWMWHLYAFFLGK
jgi:hypothetical protein